jgi:hypothetical protein
MLVGLAAQYFLEKNINSIIVFQNNQTFEIHPFNLIATPLGDDYFSETHQESDG